jgi:hypothetical protein
MYRNTDTENSHIMHEQQVPSFVMNENDIQ